MDSRSLRYFQAVAEFGSYSRGAEFLRISQPAVSRQIRMLEQELGRPLFARHSHGVNLTEAGRTLLERSQSILRQFDRAREDVRNGVTGPSGTVTIAVPPAAGNFLVPALAQRFAQWLVSPEGQAAIGGYEVAGEQLFHPSAAVPK